MEEYCAEFGFFKDFESFPFTLPCHVCDMLVSDSLESLPLESLNDPPVVDCDLFKAKDLRV